MLSANIITIATKKNIQIFHLEKKGWLTLKSSHCGNNLEAPKFVKYPHQIPSESTHAE